LTKKASSTGAIQRVVPPPAGSPTGPPRRADQQRQSLRRNNSTASSPAVPRPACPSDSLKGTSTDARIGPPPTRLSEMARPKSATGSSGTAVAASCRPRPATACNRPTTAGLATDRQATPVGDILVASQLPESALAGRIRERVRSRLNEPPSGMQMVALKLQKQQQESRAASTGRSGRSSGAYPVSHSPVATRGPHSACAPSGGGAASPQSPPAQRDARSSVRTPARGTRPAPAPAARSAKAPPGSASPTTSGCRPSAPSRGSPATTRAPSLSRTSPAEATERSGDASVTRAVRAQQSRGASPPRTTTSPARSRRLSPPPPRQTSPSPMRQAAAHTRSAACLSTVADAKASDGFQVPCDAMSSPGDLGRMASITNLLERAEDMSPFTAQGLQTADLQGKLAMLQQVASCGANTPPRLWPNRQFENRSADRGSLEAADPATAATSVAGLTKEGLQHLNRSQTTSKESRSMAEVEQENRELRMELQLLQETLCSVFEACGSPPHTWPISKSLSSCVSPLGKQTGSPGLVGTTAQLSWPTVEVNTPETHWPPRQLDVACPSSGAPISSQECAVAAAAVASPPAEQKVPSAEKLLQLRNTTTFAWLQPELSLAEDVFRSELASGLRAAAVAEELTRASLESTRSMDSGMLPQNMDRTQVYRPHSVPPLNLSGLMGNPSDSEEGSEVPAVDNTIRSEGSWQKPMGFATRSAAADALVDPNSPQKSPASHFPLRGGSSTASTRAGSTPSCNNNANSNVLSPSSGKRSSHLATRPARPAWCMEARQLPAFASSCDGWPGNWPPFDAGLPSGAWPPTLAPHGSTEVQAQ